MRPSGERRTAGNVTCSRARGSSAKHRSASVRIDDAAARYPGTQEVYEPPEALWPGLSVSLSAVEGDDRLQWGRVSGVGLVLREYVGGDQAGEHVLLTLTGQGEMSVRVIGRGSLHEAGKQ